MEIPAGSARVNMSGLLKNIDRAEDLAELFSGLSIWNFFEESAVDSNSIILFIGGTRELRHEEVTSRTETCDKSHSRRWMPKE